MMRLKYFQAEGQIIWVLGSFHHEFDRNFPIALCGILMRKRNIPPPLNSTIRSSNEKL